MEVYTVAVALKLKKSVRSPSRAVRASRGVVGVKTVTLKRLAAKTVTLKRLAAKLSEAHEMPKKQTEAMLGDLADLVTKHLKKGDRIRIGGILVMRKRTRIGRNSATGEAIQIKASKKGLELDSESAPEPAERAYQPSARALAILRGKEICESDLRDSGGAFTLQQIEKLLGISRQAVDKKVHDDALLAVPGPHGRRQYPVAQFTEEGILPGLGDLLKALPSANGWFRLNFLIRPDARLNGRRPIDLLKEGKIEPVVVAAKAVGVQGA
jgi:nucleoid DNA-binding protein